MNKLKIAIVISTTRAARFGHKPAQWISELAAERDDMEIETVDLRDSPCRFSTRGRRMLERLRRMRLRDGGRKRSPVSMAISSLAPNTPTAFQPC